MTAPDTGGAPAAVVGSSTLGARVPAAVVLAALALGTAWLGGPTFECLWALAAILVLREWFALVGFERTGDVGWACAGLLAAAAAFAAAGAALPAAAALGCAVALALAFARPGRRAITGFGPVYAGMLALALPMLRRSQDDGLAAVLWLFAVVWGTDTMAFFGGRALGGPKLAPRLSPSKTWSGFAVGVGSGALLGLLVAPASAAAALAGVAAGAVSQAGDLFESALKRHFGVKDAGSLIPGHGGVMDRLDGFVAATALAAAVGLWRFGPGGAGGGMLRW